MTEKQTFTVRVRHYANGARYALADDQMNDGENFDDIVAARLEDETYREFDISVTSAPPAEPPAEPVGHVIVPDEVADGPVSVAAS